jgi:hypothetical protein
VPLSGTCRSRRRERPVRVLHGTRGVSYNQNYGQLIGK